jgi:hypothetical protein
MNSVHINSNPIAYMVEIEQAKHAIKIKTRKYIARFKDLFPESEKSDLRAALREIANGSLSEPILVKFWRPNCDFGELLTIAAEIQQIRGRYLL